MREIARPLQGNASRIPEMVRLKQARPLFLLVFAKRT
jgi:hypothetical protein